MELLTDRYQADIIGMISCYDRVVLTGTLPGLCHAGGMTAYLYRQGVPIFEYAKFAEPFRNELRAHAQRMAEANGLTITCVRQKSGIEGRCVKHVMGVASIKMYDKFGHVLRIETTANDISFFKHYRQVEHRDGTTSHKQAAMKKSIYSLTDLQGILQAANRRYLEFVSAIEDRTIGFKRLEQVTQPVCENAHRYRGFNFFDPRDLNLLLAIVRGEFLISGFQSKQLRRFFPDLNSGQISRLLKRLHTHGLIKKVAKTYKYYLTGLGKTVIATALKIKNLVIIPELAWMKTA